MLEIALTPPANPETGVGVRAMFVVPSPTWPKLLNPQHVAPPASVIAHERLIPAEMVLTPLVNPKTSLGVRFSPSNPSPIVPVVVGDEGAAVAASADLLAAGIFVPAIRPPTVAPGTSRLRVALSAAHTDSDIDRLIEGLGRLDVTA